jgi:hypothetical protein
MNTKSTLYCPKLYVEAFFHPEEVDKNMLKAVLIYVKVRNTLFILFRDIVIRHG